MTISWACSGLTRWHRLGAVARKPTRGWGPEAGSGRRGAADAVVARTGTRESQAETRTIRCPCPGPRYLPPDRRPRMDPALRAPVYDAPSGHRPHWNPCRNPLNLQQNATSQSTYFSYYTVREIHMAPLPYVPLSIYLTVYLLISLIYYGITELHFNLYLLLDSVSHTVIWTPLYTIITVMLPFFAKQYLTS